MDGRECSEIPFSLIELGDRIDAEYFVKKYLSINKYLSKVKTKPLGELSKTVASAFYPAATQLYSIGDTAFVRCVDCVNHPVITKEQDPNFEKIPYAFGKENKGIAFLRTGEIVVTKVGTPCYASIIEDYDEVALSRTVLGLSNICGIDPYYLLIFLRSKYGFEQLYRQRELTIQYQLTLPRVKAIKVFLASKHFQENIKTVCIQHREVLKAAKTIYSDAESLLLSTLNFLPVAQETSCTEKFFTESFGKTGRLDAEYYQPKYDALFETLSDLNMKPLGGEDGIVDIKKSIEPGSAVYCDEGIPFVRVSDISKFEISTPEIHLPFDIVSDISSLFPKKDTILFSKDGSVGIAYKMESDSEIITSGALLHLTVRNPSEVLPDYLALVLNSPVVQLQAERDSNGAVIQHWKPSEIETVQIPIMDMRIQRKISSKVQRSFSLRRESAKLLEYAKHTVEMAIEQGEDTALVWLQEKGVDA